MEITLKEFVECTSGVNEYEIWGITDLKGNQEYGFFFDSDIPKDPLTYKNFKHRKIESFQFRCERDGWVECIISLEK